MRGEYGQAAGSFTSALAAQQAGSRRGVAEVQHNACALAATGESERAERQLREVINRAEDHGRPLLVAMAERDLAWLLEQLDRSIEAQETAHLAQARFERLGARAEIQKLDALLLKAHR